LLLQFSLRDARHGQALAVAAPMDKTPFQSADLLVEQVIRLVNQANKGVGDNRRVGVAQPIGVRAKRISRIRLIGPMMCTNGSYLLCLMRFFTPKRQLPLAKKVFVV